MCGILFVFSRSLFLLLAEIRIVDTCGNLGLTVSRILALASEYDLIERLDSSSESVNKTSKREISSASSTCQLPKGKYFKPEYECKYLGAAASKMEAVMYSPRGRRSRFSGAKTTFKYMQAHRCTQRTHKSREENW